MVCSDNCGSSVLLDEVECGAVFCGDSQRHQSEVLYKWISKGPLTDKTRESIKNWADNHISGTVAAKHLIEIFNHICGDGDKPHTPWMKNDDKV